MKLKPCHAFFIGLLVPVAMLVAGCTTNPAASAIERHEQLLLVTAPDWNSKTGVLRAYQRDGKGQWQFSGLQTPVTLGHKGMAWGVGLHDTQPGLQKIEGDGRSPAGIFALGDAFGALPEVETGLNYQPMNASHYCVDVVDSPLYNQTVARTIDNEALVVGSTEPMRRDIHLNDQDQQYRLGVFVQHNPINTPKAGSCIFVHVWRSAQSGTAGCTAMPEQQLRAILGWLDKRKQPVMVVLPELAYGSLQQAWALPAIAN